MQGKTTMVVSTRILCLIALIMLLTSCLIGAGTHGSIKGYRYPCRKDALQKAILAVIKSNPNIIRDTTLDHLGSSPLLDSPDCYNCAAGENFYNDIKHYVTIRIKSGQGVNEYIFRYYGSDEEWKTLATSKIFICYAYDQNGNGGSEGNGGLDGRKKKLKKRLTDVFEKELVEKVDSSLNTIHMNED